MTIPTNAKLSEPIETRLFINNEVRKSIFLPKFLEAMKAEISPS